MAFATLTCAAILLSRENAGAVGMSAGATAWYTQWKTDAQDSPEINPGLLYGPVLGVDFAERWSVTSVFLTGSFEADPVAGASPHFRRYDSDTTLNFALSRWFKVFGGLKYMRYDFSFTENVPLFETSEFYHYAYGPGLGIGVTLPVTDSLFALVNVSGMYLAGKTGGDTVQSQDWTEYGLNTTASLAWYLASLSTTLSAGIRYQRVSFSNDAGSGSEETHSFLGVTVSAIYHFSL
ncbi:MAG: hypothetical protein EPN93_00810 [Spirochaetes bacterium]|nr:MAG: hypothetical protein EPN93_00810 [Spirochaetota bacterium]